MAPQTTKSTAPEWLTNSLKTVGNFIVNEPGGVTLNKDGVGSDGVDYGAIREKSTKERSRKLAEEMVNQAPESGVKRDKLGKIEERSWWKKLGDGVSDERLQKDVGNVETEVGIYDALSPTTPYTIDGVEYTAKGLGVDAPSRDQFTTEAEARKFLKDKLTKQVNINKSAKSVADDERKYGRIIPGEGGRPGVRTGGTVEGHRETEKFKREGEMHQSGLDVNTASIEANRALQALNERKFNWEVAEAIRQSNQEIDVLGIKNAAEVAQRDADNAQAILMHDKQFAADMEFFDRKEAAYNQEQYRGMFESGIDALMRLFN